MNRKKDYQSIIRTTEALDRYRSRRQRLAQLETVFLWRRIIPAVLLAIGIIAASIIWWKVSIVALVFIAVAALSYFGWSRLPRHRLRNNGPVPTLRITETGSLRSKNVENLRKVFKVGPDGETPVRMKDLRKGDKFRLETDDPKDHLFGKASVVYEAASDARPMQGSIGLDIIDDIPAAA